MKYIIDTDIGDDIDDAFALALALEEDWDLAGITTVYVDAVKRARITKKLLLEGGRADIPVYAGYSDTLNPKRNKVCQICQYTDDLDADLYAPDNAIPDEAIDFIIAAAKKHKKELTLVAVGPLTNIAAAIVKDKETVSLVEKIVIMGGSFFNGRQDFAEWNILCDPEAAQIVFDSGIPLECIGLDVTERTQLTPEERARILNYNGGGAAQYTARLLKMWGESPSYIGRPVILHDPLVIHHLQNPDFVKMKKIATKVKTDAGVTGQIDVQDDSTSHVSAATDCDASAFVEQFLTKVFA